MESLFDYLLLDSLASAFVGEAGRNAGTDYDLRRRGGPAVSTAHAYLSALRPAAGENVLPLEGTGLTCVLAAPGMPDPRTICLTIRTGAGQPVATLRLTPAGRAEFDSVHDGRRTLSPEGVAAAEMLLLSSASGRRPLG